MRDTRTSDCRARAPTRAPITTAIPTAFPPIILNFSGVDARAHLNAKDSQCSDDLKCAANGSGGTIECGKESVSGGIDFHAVEHRQKASNCFAVPFNEMAPVAVAELRGFLRGTNDVRKEERREDAIWLGIVPNAGDKLADFSDDRVLITKPLGEVPTFHLNYSDPRDMLGDVLHRVPVGIDGSMAR